MVFVGVQVVSLACELLEVSCYGGIPDIKDCGNI